MKRALPARPSKPGKPINVRIPIEAPVAEILFIVTYTCKTCKTPYTVPQPNIMYEYTRRGRKTITRHGFSYAGLPRVISNTTASVEACARCFMTRRHGETIYIPPPQAAASRQAEQSTILPLTLEEL